MNHIIIILQKVFVVIVAVILCHEICYCQQESSEDLRPPGFSLGFGLTPSLSQIKSINPSGVNLNYEKKYSLSGYMEIGYFFTRNIGLTTGLNYSSYSTNLRADSYTDKLDTIDQENDAYELRIAGKDIREKQHVGILGIPVCINMRFNPAKDFGVYLQAGINIAIPLENSYETNGAFTYSGYFPIYNVVLADLPEYGFPTNLSTSNDGNLKLKPVVYCVVASAGIDYIVNNKFQLLFGVSLNKSLESISEYTPAEKFRLTTGANDLNSFMEGSSNVLLQSLGINFGLRYFISDFKKHKYSNPQKDYLKEEQRGKKVYIEK